MTPYKSAQWKHFLLLAAAVLAAGVARAQVVDRIPRTFDAAQVQVLANHHPLWAAPSNDVGAVPADLPMQHLTMVLARSPQQEAAFEDLLKEQQDPTSPNYHQWLTPAEIGERFGLSENDIDAITGWLQSQGLQVNWVAPSRVFIGFSGSAADVGRAFQTELHYYNVHGEQRISVATDPQIPVALAPAMKAIHGLYTIEDRPFHNVRPMASSGPDFTVLNGNITSHFLAPGDFATIYDVPPSLTGAGTTIGIVAEARTDMTDFSNFKSLTGSTFSNPTEVVPTAFGGADPGPACATNSSCPLIDDQGEAELDVMRAGSVAPGASLLLVTASADSGGIADDAAYLVQTTPVPAQVMSISFGYCESAVGIAGVAYWDTLFQQAAGEGVSVFVSSGDSGASGCDEAFTTPPASPQPNSPNYICSSSYATCVGGTEFNDTSNPSAYWNSSNGSNLASALGYIPEGAWNEPLAGSSTQVAATGGGVSTVIQTPSWQTGNGVPGNAGRYTPDISFSAANHDGYFGCFAAGGGNCSSGSGGTFNIFSGTSAAAPGMAGVAALLDQKLGAKAGNLNPELYAMAVSAPAAFNQVSVASSGVTNCSVTTPSMCNNSIPGPTSLAGGQAGFQLGANGGYSEATGLGSLDVSQFINNYNYTTPSNAPTVTVSAPPSITVAQSASVEITVTGTNGAPTGTIILTSGSYKSATTTLSIPGTNSESVYIVIPSGVLAAGTDTITATYTSTSPSYANALGSTTILVTSTLPAPTITWAAPAAIVYGTPLSATQLNATASVPGTFAYSPAAGAVLTVGQHTLAVTFTPNDTTDYSTANATVPLTVSKATPVLTWATPAAVPAGTALSSTQLDATANVPGTFTYTPVAGTLMSTPGNFMLSATFAPIDSTDYTIASASVTLSVTAVTSAPIATTGAASAILGSSATLGGQATAEGSDTHIWFLYGTSSTLSGATQTASQDIGAGYSMVNFTAGASGLSPNTTYYFQAVAQNSFGTTKGSIQNFTTSNAPTFTLNGNAVTIAKGSSTGDTSTVTIGPTGGFTGTVTLSAAVTASPTGAQDPPTFTWSPSNQVTLSGTSNASAMLIISTTAGTSGANVPPVSSFGRWYSTDGAALACIVLFWIPGRRRALRNLLGMVALCIALISGAVACGGSSNSGGNASSNPGTTSGAYTITITGTSGTTTVTNTVSLTVQ
jgi:hypothetical protein